MNTLRTIEGVLVTDVSNHEDGMIRSGTFVVVSTMVDNFKNLFLEVRGMGKAVRLNYFDTSPEMLVK